VKKAQKGKLIQKGKVQRHWIYKGLLFFGSGFLLGWLLLKIVLILGQQFLFNLSDFYFIIGLLFFLFGMEDFVSYIRVYENGVKVRRTGILNYFITRYIPYDQIIHVYIRLEGFHALSLQLKGEEVAKHIRLVNNYKEIMEAISERINPKNK
jgi:hypothetical protein